MPYLGICLGMQVAVIEFARNVMGWKDANSTEFDRNSGHPVVGLITEWADATGAVETRTEASDLGGTMRLGAQDCQLAAGSKVHDCYGKDIITERHRHRYEVNNNLLPQLVDAGLVVSGRSEDGALVEVVESRTTHGSLPASSTRSSPPPRVTVTRCSAASSRRPWPRRTRPDFSGL